MKCAQKMRLAAIIFLGLLALSIANAQPPASTPASPPAATSATTSATPLASGSAAAAATAKPHKPEQSEAKKNLTAVVKKEAVKSTDNLPREIKKLIMQDTIMGQGKIAARGKNIKVNYTGWLYDPSKSMGRGQQFSTSLGREPVTFELGKGDMIKGWDEGLENMKVGGKRKLIIPPELAYGTRGAGTAIPANATLMYEVELVDVL